MTYKIEDFAKAAGVKPEPARVMLRRAGIKPKAHGYAWETPRAMELAIIKCRKLQPARPRKATLKAQARRAARAKTNQSAEANA